MILSRVLWIQKLLETLHKVLVLRIDLSCEYVSVILVVSCCVEHYSKLSSLR